MTSSGFFREFYFLMIGAGVALFFGIITHFSPPPGSTEPLSSHMVQLTPEEHALLVEEIRKEINSKFICVPR